MVRVTKIEMTEVPPEIVDWRWFVEVEMHRLFTAKDGVGTFHPKAYARPGWEDACGDFEGDGVGLVGGGGGGGSSRSGGGHSLKDSKVEVSTQYDDAAQKFSVTIGGDGIPAAGNVRICFQKPVRSCGCCCKKQKTAVLLVFNTSWTPYSVTIEPQSEAAAAGVGGAGSATEGGQVQQVATAQAGVLTFTKQEVDGVHYDK